MSSISVIMPVRNEAKYIEKTLSQLVAQDYDFELFEILVADGESTDGTPDLVEKFAERHPNVRLFRNPKCLGSAARNVALQHAKGEIVVIVDGHCEIEDNRYLRRLADAFKRSGADCVGRPQPLDVSGATALQRAIAAARSSWLGHHPDSYVYSKEEGFVPAKSVAVAYRRAVFDKVGVFDDRFDACEDVEFNHRIDRAGLRCFFTPEVAVRYYPRETLRGLFRQMVRYGRGRVRLARKHPETFSWRAFLPLAFFVGAIAGLPLCFLANWLAMIYLSVLACYAAAILLASCVMTLQEKDARLLVWLPVVFLTLHLGSAAGLFVELCNGFKRTH